MTTKINKAGVEYIQIIERKGTNAVILCKCPRCGKSFTMQRSHFYRGSNGCKCNTPISERLYSIWVNMKSRCLNPNVESSKYYYNKGITICKEWINSYRTFENWAVNSGYAEHLTIDRIDSNGNYCPENCRWSTSTEQNRNKSNNVYITVGDVTKTLKEWSIEIKVKYKAITSFRYRHSNEELLEYISKHLNK